VNLNGEPADSLYDPDRQMLKLHLEGGPGIHIPVHDLAGETRLNARYLGIPTQAPRPQQRPRVGASGLPRLCKEHSYLSSRHFAILATMVCRCPAHLGPQHHVIRKTPL